MRNFVCFYLGQLHHGINDRLFAVSWALNDPDSKKRLKRFTMVTKVYPHPKYKAYPEEWYDAAILELHKPITPEMGAIPICLPPPNFDNKLVHDRSVEIIGMGYDPDNANRHLKVATVKLYSTEKCKKLHPSHPATTHFVQDMMICAFSPNADTCKGDSGSSLVFKEPKSRRRIILGITSKVMGENCRGHNI